MILEEKRRETKSDFVFTLLDIVTNEEFLTQIIGVLCFLLCLGLTGGVAIAISRHFFLKTTMNPRDNPVSLFVSLNATSLLTTAAVDTELVVLLELLTAYSLRTCRFLDSPSLYDVTDCVGSDPSVDYSMVVRDWGPDGPIKRRYIF